MCGIHVVPLVALSLMAAPAQAQNERATLTVSCPGLPGMFANDTPKGYGALEAVMNLMRVGDFQRLPKSL